MKKVRYDSQQLRDNCAYLDDEPDADGAYTGTNKYSDEPVRLRWTGTEWVEVG